MSSSQRDPARERFWREATSRQAASGLSVREFCRREKLGVRSVKHSPPRSQLLGWAIRVN